MIWGNKGDWSRDRIGYRGTKGIGVRTELVMGEQRGLGQGQN